MRFTDTDIRCEILDNWEQLETSKYDLLTEFADSAVPIYYHDILKDWTEMPNEFTDSWKEQLGGEISDRGIFALMSIDLFTYYLDRYTEIFDEITAQKEQEEND